MASFEHLDPADSEAGLRFPPHRLYNCASQHICSFCLSPFELVFSYNHDSMFFCASFYFSSSPYCPSLINTFFHSSRFSSSTISTNLSRPVLISTLVRKAPLSRETHNTLTSSRVYYLFCMNRLTSKACWPKYVDGTI